MFELAFGVVAGLLVGGALAWFIRGAHVGREVAILQGRLQQTESAQSILDAAKEQMRDTFEATAARALQSNTETFLTVARGEFEKKHEQFQNLVKPLSESYTKLAPQIDVLGKQITNVSTETAKLSGALTDNQRAGNWGEIQLERIVELAGMTQYSDFSEQVSLSDSEGRPDLVVKLPSNRAIVIDAKASTKAFLEAQATEDEEATAETWQRHAGALKNQVDDLSKKAYGQKVDGALDFVVMFVPGDQFLAAALRVNPGLIDYSMTRRVAIATPASLISLLWTLANGWQQDRIAREAQEIQNVGIELHRRIQTFVSHYEKVGNGLKGALKAYNDSIGSYDARVHPQGEKFSGLLLNKEDEFPTPDQIDGSIRNSTRALPLNAGDEPD